MSYSQGCLRLEIFWRNNIKVRYFFQLLHQGEDIGHRIEGSDQKGWHFNQFGSKCRPALAEKGLPEVPIKENHAATRERLTLFTFCTNSRRKFGVPAAAHPVSRPASALLNVGGKNPNICFLQSSYFDLVETWRRPARRARSYGFMAPISI